VIAAAMPGDDDGFTFDDDPLLLREPERPAFPIDAPPGAGPTTLGTAAKAPAAALPGATAEPLRRASAAARLVAFLVDCVILAAADMAVVWTASTAVLTGERLVGHPFTDAAGIVATLTGVGSTALAVGYFVVLHAGAGQTLGKAALRVRVARPDGQPIGVVRSAVRFAGYFASALPLGLGFAIALASGRRALHDYLAGTAVVRA
jgi:uncharacterized RDD family membrane protein YckC